MRPDPQPISVRRIAALPTVRHRVAESKWADDAPAPQMFPPERFGYRVFIYNDRVRPNPAAFGPLERGVRPWRLAK